MNQQEFLNWEAASRDTIDFKKCYVDVAGDLNAGLVLSEIVYWHLPAKNGETRLRVSREGFLWIACHRYEWWERTRMSPKQADRALAILVERGVIAKELFKFGGEPTVHVRLLWGTFLPMLEQAVATPPENPFYPKVKMEDDETGKSESPDGETPYTEGTAEGTASNKTRPPAASGSSYSASRGPQPKTGDTQPGSNEDKQHYSGLANFVMTFMQRKSLSKPLCDRLARPVHNYLEPGAPPLSSPDELFTKVEFQEYVKLRIQRLQERSEGQIGITKVIEAICDYNRPHVGWVAYSKNEGTMPDIAEGWDDQEDDQPEKPERVEGAYLSEDDE